MFPAIGPISKIVKILHSDAAPWQIATGVCFGMVMGLTPLLNIHNLVVLFLAIIIAANWGSLFVSLGLFSAVGWAVDPLSHRLGLALLKLPALEGVWTNLYNTPGMTWTRFNNSIVMGSLAISLVLFVPLWGGVYVAVRFYRKQIMERMDTWKVVKAIKGSALYETYSKVRDWTG